MARAGGYWLVGGYFVCWFLTENSPRCFPSSAGHVLFIYVVQLVRESVSRGNRPVEAPLSSQLKSAVLFRIGLSLQGDVNGDDGHGCGGGKAN